MRVVENQTIISYAFLAAYLLLILSTVLAFRAPDGQIDYLVIARSFVYFFILIIWLLRVVPNPRRYYGVLGLILLLAPFLFTHGYMITVDTAVLFVTASGLSVEERMTRRFFIRSAYISVAIITCVAVLSLVGVVPTMQFGWDLRIKQAVGFLNPNTFYYYLFSAAFIMFMLEDVFGFIVVGLIMAAFYSMVESRTFFMAYLLLLLYRLFAGVLNPRFRNVMLWAVLAFVTLLGMLSAMYPLIVSGALWVVFGIDPDEILSGRLDIIANDAAPDSSPLPFFGGAANYADSIYVYLISGMGVPLTIGAIFIVVRFLWRREAVRMDGKLLMAGVIYFTIGCFEVPYGAASLMTMFFVWKLFFAREWRRVPPTSPGNIRASGLSRSRS